MFEKRNEHTKFSEYFKIWPESVKQYPFFFNNEELQQLKGSPLYNELPDIKAAHKEIYNRMSEEVPGFKNFHLKEFN